MSKTERQRVVDDIRNRQRLANPGIRENDWFLDHFAPAMPAQRISKLRMLSVLLIIIVLNLFFWGVIIAMCAFALSLIF